MADRFLINFSEDSELAVLHLEHGDERCNRDDMRGRQLIDPATADALLTSGEATWCQYCDPTGGSDS